MQVRITVRPYGSVVPLGFFAFGIGMFLYAAFDAPWVPATQGKDVGLMLATFVAPLEAVATVIAFLALATQLAGIAALIDSPVLVVGAMVLGPEFAAIAAICYGIFRRQPGRIWQAVRALVVGFTSAIAITYVCALVSKWTGVIESDRLPANRPLTAFIYSPDRWSFIVALLAGAAGVLSLTAGKSSALVGVFISVTTVPAAGNLAVAMALRHGAEITGSLEQLGVNLLGMIIAGTGTLFLQRAVWSAVLRQRGRSAAKRST